MAVPSKKLKLEPEITEDGIYELYVSFNRYIIYVSLFVITHVLVLYNCTYSIMYMPLNYKFYNGISY